MRKLICFLLLLSPSWVFADAAVELKKSLDSVEAWQGRFEQVLSDKSGEKLQTSAGQFTLKRPGYFYWKTDPPYEQLVIGTPEKVWVYDPDLEQVTIRPNRQQQDSPASILSGDLDYLKNQFSIESSGDEKSRRYVLKPLDPESSYKTVTLVFQKGGLTELRFVDKLDQTTDIQFKDTVRNPDVAEDLFTFEAPDGVDVIVDE